MPPALRTGGWVLAGLSAGRLAAARAVTGPVLAVLASAGRGGHAGGAHGHRHPGRVLAGTFMFAVIYLAIGALGGTLVASPVNGTLLIAPPAWQRRIPGPHQCRPRARL